jgi:hypothetical protein
MRTARLIVTLAVALLITSSIVAAERKKAAKQPPKCPAAAAAERLLAGITLTEEQKTKIGEITKEFGPKMLELNNKRNAIVPPEKMKAGAEARKTATAAGAKGKAVQDAVDAAMKLTDEEKAKMAEVRKEMQPLEKGLREKVMALLTAEQKEEIKKRAPKPAKQPKA